ncbi:hypothetical protein X975_14895, partial [Stegodyphus mimosarum]
MKLQLNMYTVWCAACRHNAFHKNLATPKKLLVTPSLRTSAIWDNLSPVVLKPPTTENWREIATVINNEWEFTNCIGAVDGKHIVMQVNF